MSSTQPRSPAAVQLGTLEALRGVLACYVLVGHARWLLWAGHTTWLSQSPSFWEWPLGYGSAAFRFGREAVLIFFALSGFFIHLGAVVVEKTPQPVRARRFYGRRAHRLVAPYAFALAVTVVCDAIGWWWFPRLYSAGTGDALLDATFAGSGYGAASVIPALALLPSSLGLHFGSNGPLWSLAYEVVYYAVYPAWWWLRQRSKLGAFVGVPLVCLAASHAAPHPFVGSVAMFYPVWLAGAFVAEHRQAMDRSFAGGALLSAAFAVGFAGYLAVGSDTVRTACAAVFAAAAVAGASLWPGQPFPRLMATLQYLGRRSFSIYIVHFPFLALLSAVLFQTWGGRPLHGWIAAAGAISATMFGCACFFMCERHFLHRRERPVPTLPVTS